MSRLAQAGESNTTSPEGARAMARATAPSSAGANSIAGVAPESAAASAGASRPSSTTARQCASTAALSGAKSCPFPSPPAISTTARSMPSRAASVAATVVPLESLTNNTPPMLAARSMRWGTPPRDASRHGRAAVRTERADDPGPPIIPRPPPGEPRRTDELGGQGGHRGLAVRAGNRQHLLSRRQNACEELDVADKLDAAGD